MSDESWDRVVEWIWEERSYQQEKFDYAEEGKKPAEYWLQQFGSYEQRLPVFGLDTAQGAQAALKLAATAVALCEHILARMPAPKPGVPSGELDEWRS